MTFPSGEARLPIDPNVKMPRAVAAIAADANARQEAFIREHGDQPPAPPVAFVADPNAPVPPAPIPPAAPSPDVPPMPVAAQPPVPPAAPAAPTVPPEQNTVEYWQQRYRSDKGRHDVETRRLTEAMNQLRQQNQQLAQQLAQQPTQPAAPSAEVDGLINEARELFGDDMANMIDRIATARSVAAAGQVAARVDHVAAAASGDAHQRMRAHLTQTVPEWEALNEDPQFIAWSTLQDPLSGVIRGEMMRAAWDQNNGPRVANFFKSFLSEAAPAPDGSQPEPSAATPTAPPPSQRIPLASLAAPGAARSGSPPPAAPAKRTYKQSEIAQFFSAKTRGHYAGKEAEADAIERDIFAAQAEGRVTRG